MKRTSEETRDRAPSKHKTATLRGRVPDFLKTGVLDRAEETGTTESHIVRIAVSEWLDRQAKRRNGKAAA